VGSQVTGFFSSKLLVRRSDGSQMAASIPPYALLLHDLARRGQWDKATRLCRFTQVGARDRQRGAAGSFLVEMVLLFECALQLYPGWQPCGMAAQPVCCKHTAFRLVSVCTHAHA
jgi:hypothetical protein